MKLTKSNQNLSDNSASTTRRNILKLGGSCLLLSSTGVASANNKLSQDTVRVVEVAPIVDQRLFSPDQHQVIAVDYPNPYIINDGEIQPNPRFESDLSSRIQQILDRASSSEGGLFKILNGNVQGTQVSTAVEPQIDQEGSIPTRITDSFRYIEKVVIDDQWNISNLQARITDDKSIVTVNGEQHDIERGSTKDIDLPQEEVAVVTKNGENTEQIEVSPTLAIQDRGDLILSNGDNSGQDGDSNGS